MKKQPAGMIPGSCAFIWSAWTWKTTLAGIIANEMGVISR